MKTLAFQLIVLLFSLVLLETLEAASPLPNDRICTIEALPFNSIGADFCPTFYDSGLIFCSTRQAPIWSGLRISGKDMDMYYTQKKPSGSYTVPQKLKGKINSRSDDGPLALAGMGSREVWFTRTKATKNKKERPTLGLFFTTLDEQKSVSDIKSFEHNMKDYNLAHPVFSADGQELYFSADLPDSEGGTDIYVSYRIGRSWSRPQNLGPEINTWGNEKFPFIHEDGTLYFSSDGHEGMGGLDIFYTKQIGKNVWTAAQNYGEPINSEQDDFGLILTSDKRSGYFSSNRKGGSGSDDIYSLTIEGTLLEEMDEYESLPKPLTMAVVSQSAAIKENMFLNEMLDLGNIHFENRRFKITPMVARSLDKVVDFMHQHPEVDIELGAHTDALSNDEASKRLSVKRANAARAYLVNAGVNIKNMRTKGFGETELLNHCKNGIYCPKEKHLENDRLAIKITKVRQGMLTQYQPSNALTSPLPKPVSQKKKSKKSKKNKTSDAVAKNFNDDFFYMLELVPVEKIDNRIYQECIKLNTTIDVKHSPQGKIIQLGPYESIAKAKQDQEKMTNLGIINTIITDGFNEIEFDEEVPPSSQQYRVFVGPFKHVDNDTYHKFLRIKTEINIKYETNGMMIILGPYFKQSDAEHYKVEASKKVANLSGKKRKGKKKQIGVEIRQNAKAGSGIYPREKPRPLF